MSRYALIYRADEDAGGYEWTHTFESMSDDLAVNYAQRLLKGCNEGVYTLFDIQIAEQKFIASFEVSETTDVLRVD